MTTSPLKNIFGKMNFWIFLTKVIPIDSIVILIIHVLLDVTKALSAWNASIVSCSYRRSTNLKRWEDRWCLQDCSFRPKSTAGVMWYAWYGCRLTWGPLNGTGSWITYRGLFSMQVKYVFSYRNFLKDYFIFMVTSMFQVCHIF